jgi:Holliday junction resolvasome RuvABC ATP-dependent DNA helicase subunit
MENMLTIKLRGNNATVEPKYVDNVIGQEDAKRLLSFFINSHSDETPFPTTLFTGSQGLGKTYMAEKVAKALGRDFIEVNCESIKTLDDFFQKVWFGMVLNRPEGRGDNPVTVLLDESHGLSQEVTNALLSMLNPNDDNKNVYAYQDKLIEIDFRHVNFIFATTDAHMMFTPLLSRVEEVSFTRYNNEELLGILKLYLPEVEITADNTEVAEACRGRGRDAFKLSVNLKRYLNMKNTNVLDADGWNEMKTIRGIWPKGLYNKEVEFMKILKAYAPISSRNLAIKMGVNANNIEDELEIRPRELGLIESSSKGRTLTKEGEKYIENHV